MTVVLPRTIESRAVNDFLQSVRNAPSGLVIEGEAGIGKTTLWLSAIAQARANGFRVISGRPGPTEVALTYGVLADLLSDVDPAEFACLPDVQREALDRILLDAPAGAATTDERLIGRAFLASLECFAKATPVVVAVDDVQWLDTSSRAALAFAARRLQGRIGILAAIRSDLERSHASWIQLTRPDGVQWLRVTPFSLGALHALITARLGRSLSRPTMTQILTVSGGNPYYALELARTVADQPRDVKVQLPATLAGLVEARIGRMSERLREVLLAVASAATPTVELAARACDTDIESVVALLEEAETADVVYLDGNRIEFTHPLLAAGVYTKAERSRRRAMHRKLAGIVEEPELKARHLALSATSGDPVMLEALDAAAVISKAKGAPGAAAELIDLAISLGGDTPLRRIQSADNHLHAGDALRARMVLEPAIEALPAGTLRAMGLNLLARVCIYTDGLAEAAKHSKAALPYAGDNTALAVHSLLMLSFSQIHRGEYEQSLRNIKQAAIDAERLGIPSLTSQVLITRVMVNCIRGNGIDEASLERALALEDRVGEAPIVLSASANNAQLLAWKGDLDAASAQMREVCRACEERGAEDALLYVEVRRALIELWRGNLSEATVLAEDALQRAEQLGGTNTLVDAMTAQTAVATYAGREDDARDYGGQALKAATRCSSKLVAAWPTMMLGFLEVSLGRYSEALESLEPLVSAFRDPRGTEIISASFIPDAVEAMVALAHLDDAEPFIAALEQNGTRLDRPWMLAVGARCRGMWWAGKGDLKEAIRSAHQAMRQHDRLAMPFERARSQLLLGQLQRRSRQKESAAATLSEALCVFETIGTQLWVARARAERERTKVAWSRDLALSPSEQRVAELAASGMTNRDIAASVFISEKTVEANMTRIYRKLGIRSRAELGRRLDTPRR